MSKENRSGRVHYAWAVCISCLLLIFIAMGITNNGLSIFLPFLRKINDFSNTQTSMLVNIRTVVTFFAMMFVNKYYQKFTMRQGTFISCMLVALGFFIYSVAGSRYPIYCIAAAVTGISYGVGAMIPMSILMKTWFYKSSNLAVGICTAGSGIASIILPTVINVLVGRVGLKMTFFFIACLIVVLAIIIVSLMRNKPEDIGLMPYGMKEGDSGSAMVTESIGTRVESETAPRVLPKKLWVYLIIAALVMGILANPAYVHLSVLFTTEGYSTTIMAYLITTIGVILTVSKVIFGRIADKLGGKRTCTLFSFILFAGMALCALCFLHKTGIIIAAALISGIGLSISTVSPSVWSSDIALTGEQYPKVLKRIQLLFALGAMLFQSVPGILADIFGTYTISYAIFAVLILISLFAIRKVYKIRAKL